MNVRKHDIYACEIFARFSPCEFIELRLLLIAFISQITAARQMLNRSHSPPSRPFSPLSLSLFSFPTL